MIRELLIIADRETVIYPEILENAENGIIWRSYHAESGSKEALWEGRRVPLLMEEGNSFLLLDLSQLLLVQYDGITKKFTETAKITNEDIGVNLLPLVLFASDADKTQVIAQLHYQTGIGPIDRLFHISSYDNKAEFMGDYFSLPNLHFRGDKSTLPHQNDYLPAFFVRFFWDSAGIPE